MPHGQRRANLDHHEKGSLIDHTTSWQRKVNKAIHVASYLALTDAYENNLTTVAIANNSNIVAYIAIATL